MKNLCNGCTFCCEHVALEIDKPNSKKRFEEILWFILHKKVWVWVDDDGSWYLQFDSKCEWLKDGECSNYKLRPDVCRKYKIESCYMSSPEAYRYKLVLKTSDDLFNYLKKKRKSIYKKMMESRK